MLIASLTVAAGPARGEADGRDHYLRSVPERADRIRLSGEANLFPTNLGAALAGPPP